jgi:hypothetical protein
MYKPGEVNLCKIYNASSGKSESEKFEIKMYANEEKSLEFPMKTVMIF